MYVGVVGTSMVWYLPYHRNIHEKEVRGVENVTVGSYHTYSPAIPERSPMEAP